MADVTEVREPIEFVTPEGVPYISALLVFDDGRTPIELPLPKFIPSNQKD